MSNLLIPHGWAVLRLHDIAKVTQGKNLDKMHFNDRQFGLPYITGASCIRDGMLCINRWTQYDGGIIAHRNDIIVSCVGTLGKIGVNQIGDAVLSKHVFAVTPLPGVTHEYLLLILAQNLPKIIPEKTDGVGFSQKLEIGQMEQLELNLPPQPEQERITERMITIAQAFLPAERRFRAAQSFRSTPYDPSLSLHELIRSIRKGEKEVTRCLRDLEALLPDECDLKDEIQQFQQEHFIL